MDELPLSGARRGTARGPARLAISFSLTAALLAPLVSPASPASPAPPDGGADAFARTDPREPGVRIAQFEPSPDGRWVALTCTPERGREVGVWLVDLQDGQPRPVDADFPARPSGIVWSDEGQLGVELATRATGRHWVDPQSRAVVRVDDALPHRDRALRGGWATFQEHKQRGQHTLRVQWAGRDLSLELPADEHHRTRVGEQPGVVFHSVFERGTERIFRHDLETGRALEVYEIESDQDHASWSVAPDGRALWVQDDHRQRILDAETGDTLVGPWVSGAFAWLERDGSRFGRLETGGHVYLVDVVLDRQVHLGEAGSVGSQLRVLADGRFLLLDPGGRLDLYDAAGEQIDNLIPGAEVRTASR
jgi:dipeptidyl aminopeptidase/acylaminoacyl peptidase